MIKLRSLLKESNGVPLKPQGTVFLRATGANRFAGGDSSWHRVTGYKIVDDTLELTFLWRGEKDGRGVGIRLDSSNGQNLAFRLNSSSGQPITMKQAIDIIQNGKEEKLSEVVDNSDGAFKELFQKIKRKLPKVSISTDGYSGMDTISFAYYTDKLRPAAAAKQLVEPTLKSFGYTTTMNNNSAAIYDGPNGHKVMLQYTQDDDDEGGIESLRVYNKGF